MKNFFLTVFVLSSLNISFVIASEQTDNKVIVVDGPLVVGYFPPVTQEEMDDSDNGAVEGMAHVNFSVEDTLKCLEDSGIKAKGQIIMGKVLEFREGNATNHITLPTLWPEAAGVYLFLPGKQPRKVSSQAGPSSLIVLVPEAAAEYFGAKKCSIQ